MLKKNQSGDDKDRSRSEIEANDSLNELSDSLENLAIQQKDQNESRESSLLERGPTGGIPNVSSGYSHWFRPDGQGIRPQQGISVIAENRRKLEEGDEQPSKFLRQGVSHHMAWTSGVQQQVQSPRVSLSDVCSAGVEQQSHPCLSGQGPGVTLPSTWFSCVNQQNPYSSVNVNMADTTLGTVFPYIPQFFSESCPNVTDNLSTRHKSAQAISNSQTTASQPMPSNTAMIFNGQSNYTVDMSVQEMSFDSFPDNTDGSQSNIADMILDSISEQEKQQQLGKIEGQTRNDTKHRSGVSDGGFESTAGSPHDQRVPSPGHCQHVTLPLTSVVNFFDNTQTEKQINEPKDTSISGDQTNSSIDNSSIGSAGDVFDGLDLEGLDSVNMADLLKPANQETSASSQPAMNSFHNMNAHSPAPAAQPLSQLTRYLQQSTYEQQQAVLNTILQLQNIHKPCVSYSDNNEAVNSFQITHNPIVLSENSTSQTAPSTTATSVGPVCSTTPRTETNLWSAAVDRPVTNKSNTQNTSSYDQQFSATRFQRPKISAYPADVFPATTIHTAAPKTFQPQVLQSFLIQKLPQQEPFATMGSAATASVGFRLNGSLISSSAQPTDHAFGPFASPINNSLVATNFKSKVPSSTLAYPAAVGCGCDVPSSSTLAYPAAVGCGSNVPPSSTLAYPAAVGYGSSVPPNSTLACPAAIGCGSNVPPSSTLAYPAAVGCGSNAPPSSTLAYLAAAVCGSNVPPSNRFAAPIAAPQKNTFATSVTGCSGQKNISADSTSAPRFLHGVFSDNNSTTPALNSSDSAFLHSNFAPLQSSTATTVFQGAPIPVLYAVIFPQPTATQLSGPPPKKQCSKFVPIAPKPPEGTGINVADGEYRPIGAVCGLSSQDRREQRNKHPSMQKTQNNTYQRLLREASQKFAEIAPAELLKEDEKGDTYLHIAACQQHCHVVHALLQRLLQIGPKSLIDRGNKKGQTPLYLASCLNREKIVQLFVKFGASPNVFAESVDSDGNVEKKTAIHVAALQGSDYNKTLQELVKARDIDLNILNSNGQTALHLAVFKHGRPGKNGQDKLDSKAIVQTLIRSGAEPNTKDLSGKTALMYAVHQKKVDMVETILRSVDPSKVRTVVEARDYSGKNSLDIADALSGSSGADVWNRIHDILQRAVEGKLN